MRYKMREKLFSFTDSFNIEDESGTDVFRVKGRLISLGNQLSFEDMNGNELAFIRQKLISFVPTYQIYRDDKLWATVHKQLFTLFRAKFTVDVPGPDDFEASGDFLDHDYKFDRHGETVARVSKSWFSLTDTYGVEVEQQADAVLVLASTVVIDMICHENRD